MANPEHLALLQQGVEAWNTWRQANPGIKPDLHQADLHGADLHQADLHRADLHRADLHRADLHRADLYRADLRGANLNGVRIKFGKTDLYLSGVLTLRQANHKGVDLEGADLRGADLGVDVMMEQGNPSNLILLAADLCRANLRGADLRGANFEGTHLRGADFSEAKLWNTKFLDVTLAEVKGLDTCLHGGPSYLDFRTLQQSGPLPLVFLRGCGLPDLLIDYLPSLLNNQPIQYYSCFISYSSKGEKFARRLHADLQDNGVRCWFAPKDARQGRKLYEQISEAIRLHEKLLLVLSEHSMNSEWVRTEIAEARQREVREKRQVLFPISLVAYEKIKQ